MELGVVGAGYVGLVTAACLASLGHTVVCVERDPARVAGLSRAEMPITEPGLAEHVRDGLDAGRLRFTTDARELRGLSLVILAVGTLDQGGEWSIDVVRAAALEIAALPDGPRSIAIRSTLLPGSASPLAAEIRSLHPDVAIALNPEFTREGSAVADFLGPDRIVIGAEDQESLIVRQLRHLYARLDAAVVVTDLPTAEMIKVASNVFLAAKITFANEIARLSAATGADAGAVVDGIGLDRRIGRSFMSPGPGFGGSCLPAQSRALPQVADARGVDTPLIASIARSDATQADWLIGLARTALDGRLEGRRVALLGLTFKAGTDDLRESPALRIAARLVEAGASVCAHDPTLIGPQATIPDGPDVRLAPTPLAACQEADVVVVATEWPEFAVLDWSAIAAAMRGTTVVDARAVVDIQRANAAGLEVVGIVAPATVRASATLRPVMRPRPDQAPIAGGPTREDEDTRRPVDPALTRG